MAFLISLADISIIVTETAIPANLMQTLKKKAGSPFLSQAKNKT